MVAKQSNLEIDNFATLRRELKCSLLRIVNFTELKTEKVIKMVKIEKLILRVRTVAKRHMRSPMFTASFILVSCVKLP